MGKHLRPGRSVRKSTFRNAFRIFMATAVGNPREAARLRKNQRLSDLQRAAWARRRGA
jgi:hypothetical protein